MQNKYKYCRIFFFYLLRLLYANVSPTSYGYTIIWSHHYLKQDTIGKTIIFSWSLLNVDILSYLFP